MGVRYCSKTLRKFDRGTQKTGWFISRYHMEWKK